MKKIVLFVIVFSATITMRAAEDNDTTVINNPHRVTVITGDSLQHIKIEGCESDDRYIYENTIQLVDTNYVSEQRTYRELKSLGWDVGKKTNDGWRTNTITLNFGLGVSSPTGMPDDYHFRPFKSWEGMIWVLYNHSPRKSLQTYSAGLGMTVRSYGLSDDQMLIKDDNGLTRYDIFPEHASSRRSHISVGSISIPLLFTQKFGQKNHFKITAGPVVNFNFGNIRNNYKIDDREYGITFNKIGIRPVTIDLMAMLKVYGFGFYVKYSPMTLFKDGRGPQFHSMSFGIYL